mmetsp:Transcript_38006/g.88428  ORF Transcript_38006/g.88428 Transcript_38006/m.88428 type:complete len:98 (-) Transcript_38006:820-1113(-)
MPSSRNDRDDVIIICNENGEKKTIKGVFVGDIVGTNVASSSEGDEVGFSLGEIIVVGSFEGGEVGFLLCENTAKRTGSEEEWLIENIDYENNPEVNT